MIKFFKKIIPAWLILLPYTAWGQATGLITEVPAVPDTAVMEAGGGSGGGGLWNLFYIVMDILSQLVILLVALAVVFFSTA